MPTSLLILYQSDLLDYMYFSCGFHIGDLVSLLFVEERMSDFAEMLLHHLAAAMLCFVAIYGNFIQFGAVIAYLHDIADITSHLSRFFNSINY